MVHGHKGNVLLVDDDPSLLILFEKVLTKSRFTATTAASVDRAEACFRQQNFDLMICDLSVPGHENIFEFVSTARERHPDIPILIITGYTPDDIALRARRLGLSVLEKPFTPNALVERITLLLNEKAA